MPESTTTPSLKPSSATVVGPPWVGSIHRRGAIDACWLGLVLVMLLAGVVFFGWYAAVSAGTATVAALITYALVRAVVRFLRPKFRADPTIYVLWLGLLAGLCLPAMERAVPPVLPMLAGIVVGLSVPFVGRTHRVRVHPVVLAVLVAWGAGSLGAVPGVSERLPEDWPRWAPVEAVLSPGSVVVGDLERREISPGAPLWVHAGENEAEDADAIRRARVGAVFTGASQRELLREPEQFTAWLGRGALPPLEDVVLGAVPGPVGATSPLLLTVLGLVLLHQRITTWQVPVATLLGVLLCYPLMPIQSNGQWTIVLTKFVEMGPLVTVNFLGYLLLGTPLALAALILAPLTQPLSRSGRLVYGLVLGVGFAAALWFLPAPELALLALVAAGLLSRPLDAVHRTPFR